MAHACPAHRGVRLYDSGDTYRGEFKVGERCGHGTVSVWICVFWVCVCVWWWWLGAASAAGTAR